MLSPTLEEIQELYKESEIYDIKGFFDGHLRPITTSEIIKKLKDKVEAKIEKDLDGYKLNQIILYIEDQLMSKNVELDTKINLLDEIGSKLIDESTTELFDFLLKYSLSMPKNLRPYENETYEALIRERFDLEEELLFYFNYKYLETEEDDYFIDPDNTDAIKALSTSLYSTDNTRYETNDFKIDSDTIGIISPMENIEDAFRLMTEGQRDIMAKIACETIKEIPIKEAGAIYRRSSDKIKHFLSPEEKAKRREECKKIRIEISELIIFKFQETLGTQTTLAMEERDRLIADLKRNIDKEDFHTLVMIRKNPRDYLEHIRTPEKERAKSFSHFFREKKQILISTMLNALEIRLQESREEFITRYNIPESFFNINRILARTSEQFEAFSLSGIEQIYEKNVLDLKDEDIMKDYTDTTLSTYAEGTFEFKTGLFLLDKQDTAIEMMTEVFYKLAVEYKQQRLDSLRDSEERDFFEEHFVPAALKQAFFIKLQTSIEQESQNGTNRERKDIRSILMSKSTEEFALEQLRIVEFNFNRFYRNHKSTTINREDHTLLRRLLDQRTIEKQAEKAFNKERDKRENSTTSLDGLSCDSSEYELSEDNLSLSEEENNINTPQIEDKTSTQKTSPYEEYCSTTIEKTAPQNEEEKKEAKEIKPIRMKLRRGNSL